MSALVRDLRFAVRQLIRNPGVAAAAILTLALGWGAYELVRAAIESVRALPRRNDDMVFW